MMSLHEIVGMEGDTITMQEIFSFELLGITEDRKVKGEFVASGIRPRFMKRLEAMGLKLPTHLFRQNT